MAKAVQLPKSVNEGLKDLKKIDSTIRSYFSGDRIVKTSEITTSPDRYSRSKHRGLSGHSILVESTITLESRKLSVTESWTTACGNGQRVRHGFWAVGDQFGFLTSVQSSSVTDETNKIKLIIKQQIVLSDIRRSALRSHFPFNKHMTVRQLERKLKAILRESGY